MANPYAQRVGSVLNYVCAGKSHHVSHPLSKSLQLIRMSFQIVHAIYKRHEIQPSSYLSTMLLLLVPPSISTVFYHKNLQSMWLSVLASFSTFYFVLASSIVAYRLSPMHPLYAYPGPIVAKISKFWMVRIAATGKMNEYVKNLHDRYGPYVRIGE